MVLERAYIDRLDAGVAELANANTRGPKDLAVTIHAVVPDWLGELVERASAVGVPVVVIASPPDELRGEERAGWEIGVAVSALRAGASDVEGVDRRRVERVCTVLASLAEAGTPGRVSGPRS